MTTCSKCGKREATHAKRTDHPVCQPCYRAMGTGLECKAPGCTNAAWGLYCGKHRRRVERNGDALTVLRPWGRRQQQLDRSA